MELTYQQQVQCFKALSDETRLQIIEMLTMGELCACKILEKFQFTQPTLSYHMKNLTQAGLVYARKEGKWTYYSLNEEIVKDNEEVKKAKSVLYVMSEDEELRRLAELKEKAIRDEKSAKYRWTEEGIKEGKRQGIEETLIKITKKLKEKNVPIEIIIETTGLSKEEINEIK